MVREMPAWSNKELAERVRMQVSALNELMGECARRKLIVDVDVIDHDWATSSTPHRLVIVKVKELL